MINELGKIYGRLTVISASGKRWKCVCKCGTFTEVFGPALRSGRTKSCGCLRKETTRQLFKTHGCSGITGIKTRLYSIWASMKTRCYNPACECFKHYGGKGIKVCSEWHSFEAFNAWALRSGYSEELLIDRIKGDKDYCPENCRWATKQQQACNRSGGKPHYKGASKFGERWRARITVLGKTISLGLYDSEEVAAHVYDSVAKIYHGEFARPNFTDTTPLAAASGPTFS